MDIITNEAPPSGQAIKISMTGLLVLAVNKEKGTAQVGVYRHAKDHELTIQITRRNSDSPSPKTDVPIAFLKEQVKNGNISLAVSDRAARPVCLYHSAHPATDEQDFRNVIDLEGPDFHAPKLDFVKGVLDQIILLNNGIFYAETVEDVTIKRAFEQAAEQAALPTIEKPGKAAKYISANLYLSEGEKTILSYGDGTPVSLELPHQPGFYYEIKIENECIKPPQTEIESAGESDVPSCPSDFYHYYNIANVPVIERLDVIYEDRGGGGSERTPCDPVCLGNTPELFP